MKILLVSNQIFADGRVTNPVLQRMASSLERDNRVGSVTMMPVVYTYSGLRAIRNIAKNSDIIHIHFIMVIFYCGKVYFPYILYLKMKY